MNKSILCLGFLCMQSWDVLRMNRSWCLILLLPAKPFIALERPTAGVCNISVKLAVGKRNQIADLLFSSEFDSWGNPKGIGLSMWRFNIGSGSHEAGDNGGVTSQWRRTECF